jgi:hypothetical protein
MRGGKPTNMERRGMTPLHAIARGLLAGGIGTAAMTLHQRLRSKFAPDDSDGNSGEDSDSGRAQEDPWREAPAPALVGKRLLDGVFAQRVSPDAIPWLTQVMHWSYGTAWGAVYAVARESIEARARQLGPLFGVSVWAASYAQLVPMEIYEPPWRYPVSSLADDLGFHLTYGVAVAEAYDRLRR